MFRFCNGNILVTQRVRPESAVQCFFVGLKNVLAQAKAAVKEGLIILVGAIKILNKAD